MSVIRSLSERLADYDDVEADRSGLGAGFATIRNLMPCTIELMICQVLGALNEELWQSQGVKSKLDQSPRSEAINKPNQVHSGRYVILKRADWSSFLFSSDFATTLALNVNKQGIGGKSGPLIIAVAIRKRL
jgi:hypothetical protein